LALVASVNAVEHTMKITQASIASLPENQQEAAMSYTERASERYPSVLVDDCRLHVFETGGLWDVWLNCSDADFTGICLAADCQTRDQATTEAMKLLGAVLAELKRPQ
jgi:hypothetical protein